MSKSSISVTPARVVAVHSGQRTVGDDLLAVEEPMEIRVVTGQDRHSISVTMRTPGNDFELAAGFLLSEGVIKAKTDIQRITYCAAPDQLQQRNIVNVHLVPATGFDPARFSRHVYTTSSCGICGKTSLDQVRAALPAVPLAPYAPSDAQLLALPEKLRQAQVIFAKTGGLHAAALFDARGDLRLLREDVGRHNALDKLVGAMLLADAVPARDSTLLVSGRASFELVQKALVAGIPAMAAVGAPSSLAVDLAREFGMMLAGFLRDGRFNVYTAQDHGH